jgi:hypothetical protein
MTVSKTQHADIINDFKKFLWANIIDYGNSVSGLNDRQYRFLKGKVIEKAVEFFSNGNLIYTGDSDKDYFWPKYNISVEAKTQFSQSMFYKDGSVVKSFSVKLTNSNGTNKKTSLTEEEIPEYVLVIRNDGAFVITRDIVIKNSIATGDGFICEVTRDDIILLTNKIISTSAPNYQIKKLIEEVIEQDIKNYSNHLNLVRILKNEISSL